MLYSLSHTRSGRRALSPTPWPAGLKQQPHFEIQSRQSSEMQQGLQDKEEQQQVDAR
ncbi:MAG: hypothetical protein H6750_03295 [Nitrospiraceae bacterium]|nr:hypothetical protein [Nitrospiraceae bacterium]